MRYLLILLLFVGCSDSDRKVVNVAVASNVSYVVQELKSEFEKLYPDTEIRITIGSSGKLTAQIMNEAPYHIFMSADVSYPETLFEKGFATSSPIVYAKGELALLSSKERNLSLETLFSDDISKIAVANPKIAPYGKASFEVLEKLDRNISDKLVFGESISQTLSYTLTVADIGFVAKSALYSPKLAHLSKNWIEIPKEMYFPIKQGVVILENGKDVVEVENFFEFLLNENGQNIFKKFGYGE
jgi:molybdate transport system substrate-binding protein